MGFKLITAIAVAYFAIAAYPSAKRGWCLLRAETNPTIEMRIDRLTGEPVCTH